MAPPPSVVYVSLNLIFLLKETEFVQFMSNPESTTNVATEQKDDWRTDSKNVFHLTDDTFGKVIQSQDPVLVMFYAPCKCNVILFEILLRAIFAIGCGHCKRMKPDYVKAAEELKAEGIPGQMAMVDCTVNTEVAEEYQISGFPTIKLFRNGKFVSDYEGKRTKEDLKQFIKSGGKQKDEL